MNFADKYLRQKIEEIILEIMGDFLEIDIDIKKYDDFITYIEKDISGSAYSEVMLNIDKEQLSLNLKKEDYIEMMNLALEMDDRDWFNSLKDNMNRHLKLKAIQKSLQN